MSFQHCLKALKRKYSCLPTQLGGAALNGSADTGISANTEGNKMNWYEANRVIEFE